MPTPSPSALASPRGPGGDDARLPGKSGAKKARGLSGLFADLLSQAQKGLKPASTPLVPPPGSGTAAAARAPQAPSSGSSGLAAQLKADRARLGIDHARLGTGRPRSGSGASSMPSRAHPGESAESGRRGAGSAPSEPGSLAGASAKKLPAAAKLPRSPFPASESEGEGGKGAAKKARAAEDKRLAKNAAALEAPGPAADRAEARTAGPEAVGAVDGAAPAAKKPGAREPRVSVLDLRRQTSAHDQSGEAVQASDPAKAAASEPKVPASGANVLVRELSLEKGSAPQGSRSPLKAEGGANADFQSVLAERLRDTWNGDIVQSAHIVLKDGDSGTIRLRLKPESLGNVKIELNLSDNSISGRIVVESDEAKNAFEKNMGELADAFKQGGFDSARLEVAVGGGSGGMPGGASGGSPGGSQEPFYSDRFKEAIGSEAAPTAASSAYARRGGAVDILA